MFRTVATAVVTAILTSAFWIFAYNTGALPTAEARKVKPSGIVVLHLSNRNLALVSEAARVAASLQAPTLYRLSDRFEQPFVSYYGGLAASVMIVARDPMVLSTLALPSGRRACTSSWARVRC